MIDFEKKDPALDREGVHIVNFNVYVYSRCGFYEYCY